MNRTCVVLSMAAGMAMGAAAWASSAQDSVGPAAPSDAVQNDFQPSNLLGASFENQSAGISLRLPAGLHRVRSSGAGDDLGQFGDEKRNWQLKITRIVRTHPSSLVTSQDNFGKPVPGLLDQTVERVRRDLSGCKILRQDLTNIRDGDPKIKDNVGMLAVRYSAAGGHYLTQQAIIQANDRLFYLLALTTPGGSLTGGVDDDPTERTAVETFRQMLDSVRLLDTAKIAQDQMDRLIRTRALMVNWTASRLHSALINEQWLRVLRNGKDVGYSYVTEQTAAGVPRPLKPDEIKEGKSDRDLVQPGDGVLIGIRARSLEPVPEVTTNQKPRSPAQVDSATWLFVTPDRRLEDWSRLIVVDDGAVDKDGKPVKTQTEEFGSSNKQIIRSLDKNGLPGTPLDKNQPPVSIREQYSLDVTTIGPSGAADPVHQDLPPWYLPQALGYLLPRLLPLQQPKSYLFATYIPDVRGVMLRYIDVGNEQEVTLMGKTFRAIPISDRIGWHGSITTHYMSPDGTYLGSENKDSHLVMLPSDAQTLLSIWKNANLTRPDRARRP